MRPGRSLEAVPEKILMVKERDEGSEATVNHVSEDILSKGVILDTGSSVHVVPDEFFVEDEVRKRPTNSLTGASMIEMNSLGDGRNQNTGIQIASLGKLIKETGCEMNLSPKGMVLKDKSGKIIPISVMNNIPYLPTRRYVDLILPGLKNKQDKTPAMMEKIRALERYANSNDEKDAECHVLNRMDDEEWRRHCTTHIPAMLGCEVCNAADNSSQPHRKTKREERSRGTLSLDISGPHNEGLMGMKYLLVAVYRPLDEKCDNSFPFVKCLKNRTAVEVTSAVRKIILKIRTLWDTERGVLRVHSDAAGEFLGSVMQDLAEEMQFDQTHTGGYNPRSNGLAERYIGLVKQTARALLIQAKMSTRAWPLACLMAAKLLRMKGGCPKQKEELMFGCPVLYRTGGESKESFSKQRQEGWYMGPNEAVKTGGLVWTGSKIIHANNIKEVTRSESPAEGPRGLKCLMVTMTGENEELTNPVEILEMQTKEGDNMMSPFMECKLLDTPVSLEDQDEDNMIDDFTMMMAAGVDWTPLRDVGLNTEGVAPEVDATAIIVSNKEVMGTSGSERLEWIRAAEKELQSITDLDVFEEYTNETINPIVKEARNKGLIPEF